MPSLEAIPISQICDIDGFREELNPSYTVFHRTTKTSFPLKWRDWLRRCAATASLRR
jgi:hypothetical protein